MLIAKLLSQSAHVYVWDEPLSFIDALSKVQIENLILDYKQALIFVKHDETFVGKISAKQIVLDALD